MKRSPGHQDTKSPGLQNTFLAILSGILLALSFPGVEAAWLAWISFLPLFFALEQKSGRSAFFLSYLSGIVFWGLTIYWLVHVTLLGTVLLVLYLALFFGLFGLSVAVYASARTAQSPRRGFLLFIPGAWVVLEYARSHLLTGFPWALVGYSQYQIPSVIQTAAVAGPWGVSFLVLLTNAALFAVFATCRKTAEKIKTLAFAGALLGLAVGYGQYALQRPVPADAGPRIKVAVIQANIPQELKWNPAAQRMIIQRYLEMSKDALAQKPRMIVWPEAAVPVVVEPDSLVYRQLADFAQRNKTSLLAGAVTKRGDTFYNSALLFVPGEETAQRYDKLHLVPFGEYIPLKRFLPFLETVVPIGDMAAGSNPVIFDAPFSGGKFSAPRLRFGVLICFEDVFPEISRGFIRSGAHCLVNLTNDAWYKRTPAARQHFQASVFRAVENNVFLVRSTNTGVSGFIRPDGKIVSLIQDPQGNDIFIPGLLAEDLGMGVRPHTVYTRFGDWLIIVCICLVIVVVLWERRKAVAPR